MNYKAIIFLTLIILILSMTFSASAYGQGGGQAAEVIARAYKELIEEFAKNRNNATLRNSKTHRMIESYDHGQGYQSLVNAANAEELAYEALSGGYRNMGNNLGEESRQTSRYRQGRVNVLDIISLNLPEGKIYGTRNEYSPTADYNSLPHISDEVAKGFYMGDDIPIPYEKRDSVIRAYFKNQRTMDSIMLAKTALEDLRMEPFRKRLDKLSDADLESWIANYAEYSTMSALAGNCYLSPKNSCPDGWQKVEEKSLRKIIDVMNDNDCGYHCDFYINEDGKYVLAFAGTDDKLDTLNWIPGAISKLQGTNSDELLPEIMKIMNEQALKELEKAKNIMYGQTPKALETVKNIMEKLGPDAKDKLVLVGHSLGGRLASEAAIEYGLPAFTFNTAGISMETRKETKMNLDKADNAGRIINITASNDMLTNIQEYPFGKVYECLKILYSGKDVKKLDIKKAYKTIKEALENLYVYNSADIGMIGSHIELSESYSGHSIVGLNKSIEYRLEYIKKYLADRRSKRKFYQNYV